MSMINTKKRTYKSKKAHSNFMGGPSYDINDPFLRLRIAAASCFFGEPDYYHSSKGVKSKTRTNVRSTPIGLGLTATNRTYLRSTLGAIDPPEWRGYSPKQLMERSIDAALDADVERTLQVAVELRNADHIRATPQVILVRAANHKGSKGTNLIRRYGRQIIKRADEPATGLAYQLAEFGKPIPTRLKRTWKDALESFNEYQLSKYRLENKEVKTVDVMNLVHPCSEAIDKLAKGKLSTSGRTWEAIVSKSGSNKKSWAESVAVMGHMALLRNLRNLLQNKVDPDLFKDKLVKGADKGRQLPFRYFSAYQAVKNIAEPSVLDAIEECMIISLGNLPKFSGRVMSLCDNSGSATSTTTSSLGTMRVSSIGNLTGVLTGMRADEGHLGVFGDRLITQGIRKRSSIFDQLTQAEMNARRVGGDTENGIWLFWDKAIREKQHWDHVFVYSDMQAGHGGLYGTNCGAYRDYIWSGRGGYGTRYIDVPKLVNKYRSTVNPNVMVYLVQIAGYQDTIIPEFYNRTYILGGWSANILRFASEMSQLLQQ